jgi:hypothetical protein
LAYFEVKITNFGQNSFSRAESHGDPPRKITVKDGKERQAFYSFETETFQKDLLYCPLYQAIKKIKIL